jgi:DNA invertase Pin-like site-specific DNA recombinase
LPESGICARVAAPEPRKGGALLVGYARVSTGEQDAGPQVAALRAAGCARILTETVSGAARARPELARALALAGPGDVLVCTRLDRLARSLVHLLEIAEGLAARGAGFRSLADPVDTTSAQGRLALQILGAVAEFERALVRERTKAGLAAARARGRTGGNPALATPEGRRHLARARDRARSERLVLAAGDLLPLLARTRPAMSWAEVARLAAARGLVRPAGGAWTRDALIRAAGRLVRDGLLAPATLGRAARGPAEPALVELVAAIHAGLAAGGARPTLAAIARTLARQHIRAPRGGRAWSASSVANLLDRARAAGLLAGAAGPGEETGEGKPGELSA